MQSLFVYFTFIYLLLTPLVPGVGCAAETFELRPFKRQLSFTGFTRPQKELVISSEVSGRSKAVLLEQGDTVAQAGVVALMDSTFIELDLQKNRISQEQASSQLKLEKKTLSRYTTLIKSNSAAQATYDDAVLRADILQLALKNHENEQSRLQELLARHTLFGPVGWKVMERYVEPGEFIHQGQQVLRLGDFRKMVVPFFLTYNELSLLQQREQVMLLLPDLGLEVAGKIFRIAPGFNEKTRKIPVELLINTITSDGHNRLRGGMRTILRLEGKAEENSFLVPPAALVSRYDTHWLTEESGEQKSVILLGKSDNGQYAVVAGDGLQAGTSFLLDPQSFNGK